MDHKTEPQTTPEPAAAPAPSRREAFKCWLAGRRIALSVYGIVLALLIVLLWPYMIISIHTGEVGILYSRLFGGTVLDKVYKEGVHIILPWDIMYVYDTRLQQEKVDISVLSRGGLTVHMKAAVYFYPIYDLVPELHKEIGPEYKSKLVLPIVTSSIRNTVGSYWPEDLYTSAPLKLQDEIMVQAVEQLGRRPVVIDSLVVNSISLPQQVNESIDLKFAAEQDYLRYKYILLKAGEQLKERYIQAESVRLYQETVNRGLTENFLRWSGIEATKELAASQNAKFVIVSGPGGLPVILNTEPLPKGQKGAPPAQVAVPDQPSKGSGSGGGGGFEDSWKSLKKRLRGIEDSLKQFNNGAHLFNPASTKAGNATAEVEQ
jgi:regulator of protease activity HflC (stomatin/prohibitin superfamily)